MAFLSLIAAVSADGFISRGSGVPWDLPKDRTHFRQYTQGKWLLLGRQTYQEMTGWFKDHHPLVLTRDDRFIPFVGERVSSVEEALTKATLANQPELVVCGGGGAYAAAMPLADRLVITHVDQILGGGVRFPPFHEQDWEPVTRVAHKLDDDHDYSFEIVTYQRVKYRQKAA